MSELKLLPKGIQSFEELRDGDFIYIDKTDLIFKLVKEEKYAFLSRPRRFGKSLLVSTLTAYFEGKKELFEGLKISSFEKEWKKYPIIHFDFTGSSYNPKNGLEIALDKILRGYEKIYSRDELDKDLESRFKTLIKNAYDQTGEKVVILVDEYDKPLLECKNEDLLYNKGIFKSFFGNIKNCDNYIRFAFFTGVTKFTKVSIFSDLNNLTDLTLEEGYSTFCGITEDELIANFRPYIEKLALKRNLSFDACIKKLKEMYDGYHFCENSIGVYNPYSLIRCFTSMKFNFYWFETGTPTFLVDQLIENNYDLTEFANGVDIRGDRLLSYDIDPSNLISLLYQTGFLTIEAYNENRNKYTLSYPNNEVESAFTLLARPIVLKQDNKTVDTTIDTICDSIDKCDIPLLIEALKALLSGCPYPVERINEDIFRNYLYLILKVLSADITCESYTNKGRTDITLTNDNYVYIIELKVDKTAEEALKQIDDKGYAEKYKFDKRKVIKIGINYSNEKKNIESFLVK